jgi:bacteriocin biosynthesis cyclodehydratase domain-containing protein
VIRPSLLPGVRRLWRDGHTVQLGTDPGRALVLEFADPALARVLDLLDGSRTEEAVLREAAALGLPEAATAALLDTLRDSGFAIDAGALLPPGLPEPVRRRLATEAAALALRRAGPPARAIRRRAAAHVLITGYGRLAVLLAATLAHAGVGHVDAAVSGRTDPRDAAVGGLLPEDAGRPRRTAAADAVIRAAPAASVRPLREDNATFVVQAGAGRPAGLAALAFARRRVPHLGVEIRDGTAVVGPLVPPAGSPCLNCVDLHRRDRDPAWPALAAQLSTGPESAAPVDMTTLLTVAGYAAHEVLTYIDGDTPQTLGASVEISGPGREIRHMWAAHPACGCGRSRRAHSQYE